MSGMERSLSGLQVPASSPAAIAAAAGRTSSALKAGRDAQVSPPRHPGVVQSVSGGDAQVLISSDYKLASISPTAKAVQAGDAVSCEKRGGTWWVVAVDTWHQPPSAPAPSSVIPPSASAPPVTSLKSVDSKPHVPYTAPGSTVESLRTWATNTRAYLNNLSLWLSKVQDAIIALNDASGAQRSTIASNATATNQTRSVVTSTRDATAALRQGALQDRIIT